MSPERILELANHPDVPKFIFGSPELDEWTRKHRDPHRGIVTQSSTHYVVTHRSLNPNFPDFRVLSVYCYGDCVPRSWDVPNEEVKP